MPRVLFSEVDWSIYDAVFQLSAKIFVPPTYEFDYCLEAQLEPLLSASMSPGGTPFDAVVLEALSPNAHALHACEIMNRLGIGQEVPIILLGVFDNSPEEVSIWREITLLRASVWPAFRATDHNWIAYHIGHAFQRVTHNRRIMPLPQFVSATEGMALRVVLKPVSNAATERDLRNARRRRPFAFHFLENILLSQAEMAITRVFGQRCMEYRRGFFLLQAIAQNEFGWPKHWYGPIEAVLSIQSETNNFLTRMTTCNIHEYLGMPIRTPIRYCFGASAACGPFVLPSGAPVSRNAPCCSAQLGLGCQVDELLLVDPYFPRHLFTGTFTIPGNSTKLRVANKRMYPYPWGEESAWPIARA